jgi:hypothetical protein
MAIDQDVYMHRRVPWGAIWAGLFVVVGVEVVMQLFGAAIGLSAMTPTGGGAQGAAIWIIIWAFISTISAYFFGGWVSGLYGGTRRSGVLPSIVLWGFATTLFLFIIGSGALGSIGASVNELQRTNPTAPNQLALIKGLGVGLTWWMFITLVCSFICAILGGLLGGHQRVEHVAGEPVPPLVEREV